MYISNLITAQLQLIFKGTVSLYVCLYLLHHIQTHGAVQHWRF